MNNTFFSVIIVSFNAGESIRKTILSTLSQTYENYEIIVKDGISEDDTIKNIPEDDRIRIIERKDQGIYDAMNQAVQYASGTYAIFMNCGDLFYDDNVLEKIKQKVVDRKNEISQVGIVYGNFERDGVILKQPESISGYTLFRSTLNHQSVFFNTNTLKNEFKYNTRFRMMADYELIMRFWKKEKPFLYIDYPICRYEGNGISESQQGLKIRQQEREVIRRHYFSTDEIFRYSVKYALTFPHLRKFVRRYNDNAIVSRIYYSVRNRYYKHSR